MIRYLLGVVLGIEAFLMLLPLGVSLFYGESVMPFVYTILILLAIAVPNVLIKPKKMRFYAKDGFITVAASWILLSAFGALPFVFSGTIPNYIDAFFETVSGFTTTGASIMTVIEGFPYGVLFWRSFTHWIGGMGVLVFLLAIMPNADGNTIHLMRAEVPGPTKGKLVPKMRMTARILYGIYIALTLIEMLALCIAGQPLYHAAVNSFATAGTGGFSVLNASIGGYQSPAVEWIIAVFMLLFGINFNMYFFILIGKIKDVLKSEELRTYLCIVAASVTVIAINTYNTFDNFWHCIRASFFQVSTIISTTGFATENFDLWPELSKTVLVLLMIIGACAGSTAGGLKVSRVLLLCRSMIKEIRHVLRPRSVSVVRLDGEVVPEATLRGALGYFAIYIAIIIVTVLLISVDGFGLTTNLTATLACVNNIGPGLDAVGPTGNYAGFGMFSKILLSLNMLVGRLEIMPVIILFSPHAWKRS